MKINTRVYRSLSGEPFLTQVINGKKVEFFYMNDTSFLSTYVQKGRFYVWTSDGVGYKLLIEKGFYEKLDYFFSDEVNTIWLGFLDDVGTINAKITKFFLFGSLLASALIIGIAWILSNVSIGVIAALFVTLISNMVQSTKINKIVREKNMEAQNKIRVLLTDEGFNKVITDQEEYMREYFKFLDEELEETENSETEIEETESKEENKDIK